MKFSNLTKEEHAERDALIDLRRDPRRWFSRDEFYRLTELNEKLLNKSGSPTMAGLIKIRRSKKPIKHDVAFTEYYSYFFTYANGKRHKYLMSESGAKLLIEILETSDLYRIDLSKFNG